MVVQVYERGSKEARSPLQPGIYHTYPKVAEWETPGPILGDEQLIGDRPIEKNAQESMEILRPAPTAQSPNPGWPLPGHVMTNPGTAPGTKVWEKFQLDGHEW